MHSIEPYIRLVCEGRKTEPNYFNGLLRSMGIKSANPAFKAKDHSPLGVAREALTVYKDAIRLKIPKAKIYIFAVFDRDGHAGVPEAIGMLRDSPVKATFSNVCFEQWILLHYEQTQRQFANCDELISYIEHNHDPNYSKSGDHFHQLKNRIPTALVNATWLSETHWKYDARPIWERNPYTDVHKVVQMIQMPPSKWHDTFSGL